MTKIEGIIEMIEDGMRDARKECMWTEEMQNGADKEGAEMFLIGVHPKYQNSGLNGLIFANTFKIFSENGIKWAETNAILEYNLKNALQWQEFEHECKKRRRSYKKQLIYNK